MVQLNKYSFHFKIAYTDQTFKVSCNPNVTIKHFIKCVKKEISRLEPNCTIEIVEMGQDNNINGRDAELAPAINYIETDTLRVIYGNRWKTTSFYIRLLDI
jgi:hypothetical protein